MRDPGLVDVTKEYVFPFITVHGTAALYDLAYTILARNPVDTFGKVDSVLYVQNYDPVYEFSNIGVRVFAFLIKYGYPTRIAAERTCYISRLDYKQVLQRLKEIISELKILDENIQQERDDLLAAIERMRSNMEQIEYDAKNKKRSNEDRATGGKRVRNV